MLAPASSAGAIVVVEGPPDFRARVTACMERASAVRGTPADVIDQLQQSSREHVIRPRSGPGLASTATNGPGGSLAGGAPGAPVGSTIDWDADYPYTYANGTRRDPCMALVHELVHSSDFDRGIDDPSADAATGIMRAEIKATTVENELRDREGMEQRTHYGATPLPPGAVRP